LHLNQKNIESWVINGFLTRKSRGFFSKFRTVGWVPLLFRIYAKAYVQTGQVYQDQLLRKALCRQL